jgi:hypothetical protein
MFSIQFQSFVIFLHLPDVILWSKFQSHWWWSISLFQTILDRYEILYNRCHARR